MLSRERIGYNALMTHSTTRNIFRWAHAWLLAMALALAACGCTIDYETAGSSDSDEPTMERGDTPSQSANADGLAEDRTEPPEVIEGGTYTSKDEVALYIHRYGHLPPNFISKTKAKQAGWVSSAGNLDEVCPGMSIGGSRFYNDDGLLPDAHGRTWTECDINYKGGYRGDERIVFSDDGLIYYTSDHYASFERLY